MSKSKMKRFIKLKIKEAAFKYLTEEKNTKSKVKHIKYKKTYTTKVLHIKLFFKL